MKMISYDDISGLPGIRRKLQPLGVDIIKPE